MHIVIGLLVLAAGAYWWLQLGRNAAEAANEIVDMGRDAIGAARQWNFKRRTNVHPVDGIDDPKLAAGALAAALVELGGLPTQERRSALLVALQSRLDMGVEDAKELLVLSNWFITSCDGADGAVSRLSRRLKKLDGVDLLDPALETLRAAVAVDGELTPKQRDALTNVARTFGRS
ncbi:MAG: hypothetical protein AAFU80_25630 [Pseudomonadota bacterium]